MDENDDKNKIVKRTVAASPDKKTTGDIRQNRNRKIPDSGKSTGRRPRTPSGGTKSKTVEKLKKAASMSLEIGKSEGTEKNLQNSKPNKKYTELVKKREKAIMKTINWCKGWVNGKN